MALSIACPCILKKVSSNSGLVQRLCVTAFGRRFSRLGRYSTVRFREGREQTVGGLAPPFECLLVQTVVDVVAAFFVDDQPGVPYDAQVLRDSALGDVQPGSQGVDTQRTVAQQLEDAHAGAN
jgi:hypothetical protein